MTFRAIHKETGKIIEARKLESDPIWKTKINDEWIYDYGTIPLEIKREMDKKGIKELKVFFVKTHTKNNEWWRCHFRKENLEEIDLSNLENESEEHKLCKEGVYYKIIDNILLIDFGDKNPNLISELCSDYECNIEERISSDNNSKIGDVVLTFNKPHPILGKGIVFEVQFSSQSFYKTLTRTNDRVLKGYSVSWLWLGHFDEDNNLLDKTIKVIPFREALKKYDEQFEDSIITNYELIQKDVEEKLNQLDKKKSELYLDITKSIDIIKKEIENKSQEFKKEYSSSVDKAKENITIDIKKGVKEHIENFLEEYNLELNFGDLLREVVKDKYDEEIKRIITNFKEEKLTPKFNSINNELNTVLSATKKRYDFLLSEKINELINDKKNELLIKLFEEATKKVPEGILKDIKKQLHLYECLECNCKTPFNDIHWIKGKPVCYDCWIKLENPLKDLGSPIELNKKKFKKEEKDEEGESEGLEGFYSK